VTLEEVLVVWLQRWLWLWLPVELRRQTAAPCIAGADLQRSGVWGRGVRGGAAAGAQLAAAFVAVQVCSAGGGFGSRVSRLSSMP
jgi:hypothetical protein